MCGCPINTLNVRQVYGLRGGVVVGAWVVLVSVGDDCVARVQLIVAWCVSAARHIWVRWGITGLGTSLRSRRDGGG